MSVAVVMNAAPALEELVRRGVVPGDPAAELSAVLQQFAGRSPAAAVAAIPEGRVKTLSVEHPTGEMSCVLTLDEDGQVATAALLRTTRKLMDGEVFA